MQSDSLFAGPDAFDLNLATRVVFGAGCVGQLGEVVRRIGGGRTLIVTDAGLVEAGHVARAEKALRDAGIDFQVFDQVRENPSTLDVERCVAAAKEARAEVLVGLGGGSSLDTAKGGNFVLTNGGRMEDYWGVGKATRPMLPLVAVPTTAGTGSELQSFALIAREEDHQKMACGDSKAAARFALLDPELTASMPRSVAACTGLDALTHAVETAVTSQRNPVSRIFSRAAFRRVVRALPRVLGEATTVAERGEMLLGAALAGLAIENSMLGAAHSLANPLTAHHDVIHGQAVSTVLPKVVAYNAQDPVIAEEYRELVSTAGLVGPEVGAEDAVAVLIQQIEACLDVARIPRRLRDAGVVDPDLDQLSAEAARQWTAQFNPRPVDAAALRELYASVL